jgi:hypothetical protein
MSRMSSNAARRADFMCSFYADFQDLCFALTCLKVSTMHETHNVLSKSGGLNSLITYRR